MSTDESGDVSKCQAFLKDKKVLIVDPSPAIRSSVARAITDLGARSHHISLALDYKTALSEIKKQAPSVVISDYKIDDKNGLNVFQQAKKISQSQPESKDILFGLITASSSESSIAQAVEEDVDFYILKPFTTLLLKNRLMDVFSSKSAPNPYQLLMSQGKSFLAARDLNEAEIKFKSAVSLSEKPCLPFFYLGKVNEIKQNLKDAEEYYRQGLTFNEYHYQCMLGLQQLYTKQSRESEAYAIGKKLSHIFPINTGTQISMMKLMNYTKNYEDIDHFYELYVETEERPAELSRAMYASLVISGIYFLSIKNEKKAYDLFRQAILASQWDLKIIRRIIDSFIKYNEPALGRELLDSLPDEVKLDATWRLLDFEIYSLLSQSSFAIIEKGRELIRNGVHNLKLYDIIIQKALEAKSKRVAEALAYEAYQAYPDHQERFLGFLGRELKLSSQVGDPSASG